MISFSFGHGQLLGGGAGATDLSLGLGPFDWRDASRGWLSYNTSWFGHRSDSRRVQFDSIF